MPMKILGLLLLLAGFVPLHGQAGTKGFMPTIEQKSFKNARELALAANDSALGDNEKLYLAYQWITNNIPYDVESFSKGIIPPVSIPKILKEKKALCGGYAVLFDSVCHYLGIRSYIVYGYVKGAGYVPGEGFSASNHAWNVVVLGDNWYFTDVTWGSGQLELIKKKTLLGGILNKPAINNVYVFKHQPNDSFFMSTAGQWQNTHLPADPMWQIDLNPLSLEGFIKNEDNPQYRYNAFYFTDSLKGYMALTGNQRYIVSGLRALGFNHLNYLDAAQAYVSAGMLHYGQAMNIVPESSYLFEKELGLSTLYLEKGLFYLGRGMAVSDSLNRLRMAELKAGYKSAQKQLKALRKTSLKLAEMNQKQLNDNAVLRNKLRDNRRSLNESAYKLYGDEKIYYLERPDYLPDHFQSIRIADNIRKADSLTNLIKAESDTIMSVYKGQYYTLYDSILSLRGMMPGLIKQGHEGAMSLQQIITLNHPGAMAVVAPRLLLADSLATRMVEVNLAIKTATKADSKENHDMVKAKLKKILADSKMAKKYLFDAKKISVVDNFEEDKYDTINEAVINQYLLYIDHMVHEMDFLDSQAKPIKNETEMLKQYVRLLDKTLLLLDAYFQDNLDKMRVQNMNEKSRLKDINKMVNTTYNSTVKTMGTKKAG